MAALGGIALWARAEGMLDSEAERLPRFALLRRLSLRRRPLVTVGALEPQFYALLLAKLGLADVDPKAQYDIAAWPALKARFRELFASRPSGHWRALLEGGDACFAPVLSFAEAAVHPHNAARGVYRLDRRGRLDAREAPRFSPLE